MKARHTLGYVRVSTDKQAEEGLSLEAQTAKVHHMAALRDLAIAPGDLIIEAESAKDVRHRPALSWLLAQVDAGVVDTVIIPKLDRLIRSVKDLWPTLERLERRHVTLISVAETFDTSTPMGRAIVNIIATFAQLERETTGERTRDVLRHKKAKGERVGTLPFGFQLIKNSTIHLEPAPVEQRLLARFQALRAAGKTYKDIAAAVTAEGARTRRGTAYRHQYVARALRRAG